MGHVRLTAQLIFLPSHRCSGHAWSEVSATDDILEVQSRNVIRAGKPSDSSLSHAFHSKPDMVNMTGTWSAHALVMWVSLSITRLSIGKAHGHPMRNQRADPNVTSLCKTTPTVLNVWYRTAKTAGT